MTNIRVKPGKGGPFSTNLPYDKYNQKLERAKNFTQKEVPNPV